MILNVVSVKDRAADAYMRPFFVPTVGMAVRSFSDEVRRGGEDNPMAKHPDDYDLYRLGTFDEDTGGLESCLPELLVRGKDVAE